MGGRGKPQPLTKQAPTRLGRAKAWALGDLGEGGEGAAWRQQRDRASLAACHNSGIGGSRQLPGACPGLRRQGGAPGAQFKGSWFERRFKNGDRRRRRRRPPPPKQSTIGGTARPPALPRLSGTRQRESKALGEAGGLAAARPAAWARRRGSRGPNPDLGHSPGSCLGLREAKTGRQGGGGRSGGLCTAVGLVSAAGPSARWGPEKNLSPDGAAHG